MDWLGSNLVPADPAAGHSSGPLTWLFDVDGAAALYASYRRDDHALLTVLDPPPGTEVHVVRAERSKRWPEDLVERLVTAGAAAGSGGDSDGGGGGGDSGGGGREGGVLRYHVLPKAGHWLHVDNPSGLRDMIAPELVRLAGLIRDGRR